MKLTCAEMKAHAKMMRSPKWNIDEDMRDSQTGQELLAQIQMVHVAFFFSVGSTIHPPHVSETNLC